MNIDQKKSVSVIVPVYNTGPYLKQCLDSLISQTLCNLEIVLIDDGSTDNSADICSQYAKKHGNIVLRRQPNAGVVNALQRGLELVSGDYVAFCGSDDFVSPDYFQNLFSAAQQSNADIAQCGYSLYYDDNNTIVPFHEYFMTPLVARFQNQTAAMMDVLFLLPPLTVRRLHRREILNKYSIRFEQDIRMAEDLLFSSEFFLASDKIVQVDQTGYFYRQQRTGRLTLTGDSRLMDFFLIFDKLREFAHKWDKRYTREITLLEINTLLYQYQRLNSSVQRSYEKYFLERLTWEKVVSYCVANILYCAKIKILKYWFQNIGCCTLLICAYPFRRCIAVGRVFLWIAAVLRKGNLLKKSQKR